MLELEQHYSRHRARIQKLSRNMPTRIQESQWRQQVDVSIRQSSSTLVTPALQPNARLSFQSRNFKPWLSRCPVRGRDQPETVGALHL
jgi:hypothetical protein